MSANDTVLPYSDDDVMKAARLNAACTEKAKREPDEYNAFLAGVAWAEYRLNAKPAEQSKDVDGFVEKPAPRDSGHEGSSIAPADASTSGDTIQAESLIATDEQIETVAFALARTNNDKLENYEGPRGERDPENPYRKEAHVALHALGYKIPGLIDCADPGACKGCPGCKGALT